MYSLYSFFFYLYKLGCHFFLRKAGFQEQIGKGKAFWLFPCIGAWRFWRSTSQPSVHCQLYLCQVTSPKVTRSSTQHRTLKEWRRCSLPCVTLLMIWKHVRSAWTSCVSYSVSLCLYSYKKNESRGRTYLPRPSYLIPGNRPLFPFRLCLCLLPSSYGRLYRPTLQSGRVGLMFIWGKIRSNQFYFFFPSRLFKIYLF